MSTPSPDPAPTVEPNSARWFAEQVHVDDSALKSHLRQSVPGARNEVGDVVQESYSASGGRAHSPAGGGVASSFEEKRLIWLERGARSGPTGVPILRSSFPTP